jgi:hypothetical protein
LGTLALIAVLLLSARHLKLTVKMRRKGLLVPLTVTGDRDGVRINPDHDRRLTMPGVTRVS